MAISRDSIDELVQKRLELIRARLAQVPKSNIAFPSIPIPSTPPQPMVPVPKVTFRPTPLSLQRAAQTEPQTSALPSSPSTSHVSIIGALKRGTGQALESLGGALSSIGVEGMGQSLTKTGERLTATSPKPVEQNLASPQFWFDTIAEQVPVQLPALGTAIGAGAALGSALAGPLGAVAGGLVGLLAGAMGSRVVESAMEAGDTYNQARSRGMSHAQARKAAYQTFVGNLPLAASDFVEFGLSLAPKPVRVILSPLDKLGKGRRAMKLLARVAVPTAMEVGEEAYQQKVQAKSLGDSLTWSEATKLVAAPTIPWATTLSFLGVLGGRILDRRDAHSQVYQQAKKNALQKGAPPEKAIAAGLDAVAQQEGGVKVIAEEAGNVLPDLLKPAPKPKPIQRPKKVSAPAPEAPEAATLEGKEEALSAAPSTPSPPPPKVKVEAAPPVPVTPTSPLPKTMAPPKEGTPVLPPHLQGAKPRYSFGEKQFELKFASDLDKALYIVAQEKKSKADQQYMDWLKGIFGPGVTEEQIRAEGRKIKNHLKGIARRAEPGVLEIKQIHPYPIPQSPTVAEEAPAPQAQTETKPKPAPKQEELVPPPPREEKESAPPVLPPHLQGAKPRYKQFELKFASDLDKALYIVAQEKKSKADQQYMDWLKGIFGPGVTEEQIRAEGKKVKDYLKKKLDYSPEAVGQWIEPGVLRVGLIHPYPIQQSAAVAKEVPSKPETKPKPTPRQEQEKALPSSAPPKVRQTKTSKKEQAKPTPPTPTPAQPPTQAQVELRPGMKVRWKNNPLPENHPYAGQLEVVSVGEKTVRVRLRNGMEREWPKSAVEPVAPAAPVEQAPAETKPTKVKRIQHPTPAQPAQSTPSAETYGFPANAPALRAQSVSQTSGGLHPIRREEILLFIEKNFKVPVRRGRYRGAQQAIFRWRPEEIRFKARGIEAHAHELFHLLDKRLKLSETGQFDEELVALGKALYPNQSSTDVLRKEGVAEFGRLYLMNPSQAPIAAPTFFAEFSRILDQNPSIKEALATLQRLYQEYLNLDPVDHIRSQFARPVTEKVGLARRLVRLWRKGYGHWFDEYDVIRRAVDAILARAKMPESGLLADVSAKELEAGEKKRKALIPIKDPFRLLWAGRGWEQQLEDWIFRGRTGIFGTRATRGKPLREILQPVQDRMDDFIAYITALKADNAHRLGIETGYDPDKVEQAIEKLEKEPGFRQAAEELRDWYRDARDLLVKSGVLSEQAAEEMDAKWEWPFPFKRDFGEEAHSPFRPSGKLVDIGPKIYRMLGSERPIVNPIIAMLENVATYMRVAINNEAMQKIDDLASKQEGMGWLWSKVSRPMRPMQFSLERIKRFLDPDLAEMITPDQIATIFIPQTMPGAKERLENVIMFWRDGKPVFRQVPPDFYQAVKEVVPNYGWFELGVLRLFKPFAALLRATTTLGIEFATRNVLRDSFEAWIMSRAGIGPTDTIKAGFEILTSLLRTRDMPKDFWRVGRAGGYFRTAVVSIDRNYAERTLEQIVGIQTMAAASWPRKVVTKTFRNLQVMSEIFESVNRYAEMKKLEEKLRAEHPNWYERSIAIQTAIGGRDVTIDFARVGSKAKLLRAIVAFWNARMQGLDRFVRAHKRHPREVVYRAFKFLVIPTVLLFFLNKDNEDYWRLPRWRRDLFWNIPLYKREDGTTVFLSCPKPYSLLGFVYSILPERMLEYLVKNDKNAFEQLADRILNELPVPMPTALSPVFDVILNRGWWGGPIVTSELQNLAAEEQWTARTSEVAKAVSKMFNLSPAKIDYLIRQYTGYLGGYGLFTVDELAYALGIRKMPPSAVGNVPVVRAFLVEAPLESPAPLERFYREYMKTDKQLNTLKLKVERGEVKRDEETAREFVRLSLKLKRLNQAREAMSYLREVERALAEGRPMVAWKNRKEDLSHLSVEDRKQLIRKVRGSIAKIAAKALEIENTPQAAS